jgi:hypothetical protein
LGVKKWEDYAPCGRVILLGVLYKEKALLPPRRELRALLFPSLTRASSARSENNKALVLSHQGFFFVDKRFEISNLDLVRDLGEIIKLEKQLLKMP